jgi:hypothetical protein
VENPLPSSWISKRRPPLRLSQMVIVVGVLGGVLERF